MNRAMENFLVEPDIPLNERIVPDHLPPTAPAPQPMRHVSFGKALALYWLSASLRPHVNAGSYRRAIAAYCVSWAILMLQLGVILLLVYGGQSGPGDGIRSRLAMSVTMMMHVSSGTGAAEPFILMGVLGAPLVLAACLIALGLADAASEGRGERIGVLMHMTIKSSLWAGTFLPWLGAWSILYTIVNLEEFQRSRTRGISVVIESLFSPVSFSLVLGSLVVVILILKPRGRVRRAVQPDAEGPGFDWIRPRCEDCGYIISGLRGDSVCPECGLPVAKSLPGGRREELRGRMRAMSVWRPLCWLRIWKTLITEPDALQRVPLLDPAFIEKAFFRGPVVSGIPVLCLVILSIVWIEFTNDDVPMIIAGAGLLYLLVVALIQIPFSAAVGAIGLARFGIRDLRASSTVATYAGLLFYLVPIAASIMTFASFFPALRAEIAYVDVIEEILIEQFIVAFVVFVVVSIYACFCVANGLKKAAYANS